jgi:hypothetical protein
MKQEDLQRVPQDPWIAYLQGNNPAYPETALRKDLQLIGTRLAEVRADRTTAAQRLADNMMDFNPAAVDALIRLTLGGLPPGRDGGLLNARLRYFDPVRKRAGLPEDVAALVSAMTATSTSLTLVNLNQAAARTVVVQGGAYGEHRIESAQANGQSYPIGRPNFIVRLAPGAGARFTIAMNRYSEKPTEVFPEALR